VGIFTQRLPSCPTRFVTVYPERPERLRRDRWSKFTLNQLLEGSCARDVVCGGVSYGLRVVPAPGASQGTRGDRRNV